jgi:hypothetical protein
VDKFPTFPLAIHKLVNKTRIMRRLVKSLTTHEYFGQGQWTPDPGKAQDFPDAGKAIDTCLRYRLTDVELVLQLDAEPQEAFDTHLRLFDYGPCA